MDRMIAYCGLICTDCPAYVATQADDRDALRQLASQWGERLNVPEVTAEAVACDGCLARDGRLWVRCVGCSIRACAVARGVANCAHCSDYACDLLEAFFSRRKLADTVGHLPDERGVLDGIRSSLQKQL